MLWDPATGREVVVVVVGCGSGSDSTRTGVILRFFLLLLGKLSRDTNESNVVCFDISVSGVGDLEVRVGSRGLFLSHFELEP